MVERVKCLQAQFEGFGFGELEVLLQRQIIIVDPGPEKNRRPLLPIVLAIVFPTVGSSAGELKSEGLKYEFPLRGL